MLNASTQNREELRTEIEKIIRFDTELDFKQVPGCIVGIIDGDSTYVFSFGKYNSEKRSRKINEDDVFETGSITKLYTSYILYQLEKEGKCDLTDKVNQYIPDIFQNPRLDHLSLISLINHQSGLPLRPHGFGSKDKQLQNPYMYYTEEDVLKFFRDYIPEKEGFIYAHTNYALLEIIIQQITGMDYDDVFKKYIIDPLQLNHTFVDFPEQKDNYIVPGYDKSGSEVKPWVFSSFRGSEAVKTSMHDALVFVKNIIHPEETSLSDTIGNTDNFGGKTFNDYLEIEEGWHILKVKDKKLGIHTGRTSGHSGFMGIMKDTQTAVIVFSNSWIGTGDLGMQILRMINHNWKF